MKRTAYIVVATVLIIGFVLAGCGGSKTEIQESPQTTLGQELMDLDKAHKEGIITDDEYKKKKKDIMERYDD